MGAGDGEGVLAHRGCRPVLEGARDRPVERIAARRIERDIGRVEAIAAVVHAGLRVDAASALEFAEPLAVESIGAVVVLGAPIRGHVGGHDSGDRRVAFHEMAMEAVDEREGIEIERVVRADDPGQARRHVGTRPPARVTLDTGVVLRRRRERIECPLLEDRIVAEREAVHVHRQRPRDRAGLVGPLAREVLARTAVCGRSAHLELALQRARGPLEHNVDGARHRLRAELGRRAADDLDALDHVRRDVVQREAGRHALAVHQDLRVPGAKAAHPHRPATAAGTHVDGDSRKPLQDLQEVVVAILRDLVGVDDDLGGGRLAPLGELVALHLDLLELLGFVLLRRRVLERRGLLRGGGEGDQDRRESGESAQRVRSLVLVGICGMLPVSIAVANGEYDVQEQAGGLLLANQSNGGSSVNNPSCISRPRRTPSSCPKAARKPALSPP